MLGRILVDFGYVAISLQPQRDQSMSKQKTVLQTRLRHWVLKTLHQTHFTQFSANSITTQQVDTIEAGYSAKNRINKKQHAYLQKQTRQGLFRLRILTRTAPSTIFAQAVLKTAIDLHSALLVRRQVDFTIFFVLCDFAFWI